MIPFDLTHPLPRGRVVLEASAGTGKTYSLTGLVVRYIAELPVPVEQVLVVTFTRAAANELRERIRQTLDTALTVVRTGAAPPTHAWMAVLLETGDSPGTDERAGELVRREQRLADAISRFDDLTITTIHGFCQQTLALLGVRSGQQPGAVLVESTSDVIKEVCRDLIITTLADDPHALDTPKTATAAIVNPSQAEGELIRAVTALINNPGAGVAPLEPTDPRAARWVELTITAHEHVVRRQLQRNEVGYDSLISGVQQALAHPEHGAVVAAQLATRSSVVLVDEFQDTDRVQWDVFRRAFASATLITVGDPKQAIYRFRGADVHAYLDAVEASTALGLGVNHRSDVAVLAGIGQLLDGVTLGDSRIPFTPVEAGPVAQRNALNWPTGAITGEPAVHLRAVPLADSLRSAGRPATLSMPLVRSLVLDDLAVRTVELLDHASIASADGTRRPVEPGDIAILVPSHAEAENVAGALRRAGVPATRTRTGSVLASPAAMQWRILLAALAQPHRTSLVRAAALGWFLRTDVVALADDDDVLADLQARTAELAEQMARRGVAAFYDGQKGRCFDGPTPRDTTTIGPASAPANLIATVLGQPGGERNLTDLDHIAELLSAAMRTRPTDPTQVLRTLEVLISDDDGRSDDVMRRIDSDAHAVQITTIHGAKGLEYPIVLVPFAFKAKPQISTPFSYSDAAGRRTLDLASKLDWAAGTATDGDETTRDTQALRRRLAMDEIEGDELRLLYVALTRAQHRIEIWWAATQGAKASALGRLLLDRYGAGPVQNTPAPITLNRKGAVTIGKAGFHDRTDVDALEQIRALVRLSDDTLALTELAEQIEPVVWGGRASQPTAELQAARSTRGAVGDARWQRWSFSRLSAAIDDAALAAGVRVAHGSVFATSGQSPGDAADDRGGFDEPTGTVDDRDTVSGEVAEQLQLGVGPRAHLAEVPGGTRFGTFVHAVLEHLDCTSPDLHDDVLALVVEHAAREGLDLGGGPGRDAARQAIVDGIVAAVRTPLGPLFDGRALSQIAPRDRLAELVFDLPIASADGRFPAGAIGEVLLRHLARTDPVRPFAQHLAGEFAGFDIAGWMHGSIDGVLRTNVGGTDRYVVVDYKTNRLNTPMAVDPVAAYHPRLLVPAMEHSRYPLQALLYTVAVHRYLRWRLARAYRPDEHLGGVAYLFVRGMVGPDTPVVDGVPHGVFSWRPPAAAIVALDRLFATGLTS